MLLSAIDLICIYALCRSIESDHVKANLVHNLHIEHKFVTLTIKNFGSFFLLHILMFVSKANIQ